MEIRLPFNDPRLKPPGADITRTNREGIESQVPREPRLEDAQRVERESTPDRIDLSIESRTLSKDVEASAQARLRDDDVRSERVRELRAAHERGELNTDERVQRAADRMLEGEPRTGE